jgi:uncharacterized membrane protein YkoI
MRDKRGLVRPWEKSAAALQHSSHCWRIGRVVYCGIMNAKKIMLVCAAMSGALVVQAQERVEVRDLPAGVQRTIEGWRTEGPVKQVTRHTIDGRTVYEVEIDRNNLPNPRRKIAEDGSVLRDPTPLVIPGDGVPIVTGEYGSIATPVMPRMTLEELPATVQQTARTEARGREIVDIDRETWKGQPIYEIEFKERGLNSRVYIGTDGQVVRDERRPGQTLRSLFLGTQLEETPASVQEAIKRTAGDREILDIDRKGTGAQATYRVEIRDGQTRQELRIGADGNVIYDSRSPTTQRRG